MAKPTLENTLLECIDNIPFYSKEEYQKAKNKIKQNIPIDDILLELPEIDGKTLITSTQSEFVPRRKGYYVILQTSGSTGKPKKIYYSPATSQDLNVLGIKMLRAMGVRKDSVVVTNLPREPAASGYGFREFIKRFGLVDMVLWPGQNIMDMLKYVDEVVPSNKELLLCGATSMIIRNFYSMPENEQREFSRILKKYKAKVVVGGEPINSERVEILKNVIGYSVINNLFACTEGVLSCGHSETSDNLLLSSYNFHYMLKDNDGKIYGLNEMKGKTGELIITSKTRHKKRYGMVFIKYNLHDVFEIKEVFKDGTILCRYLDRSDDIKHIGVGKVTANSLDEVVMHIGKTYGTKEWYAEISQKNGLDDLHFYIERGDYKGDQHEIEHALKLELQKRMLEFEFMFKDNLISVSLNLVSKEDVPFYKEKYKAKRLLDLRSH